MRAQEVHPPLRDLCVSLERVFHHRVYTNLYAGWRADNGFGVHWDAQNNVTVQHLKKPDRRKSEESCIWAWPFETKPGKLDV